MPLRPMTAGDVLDGGIEVIKAAPRAVLGIAAAIVVPLELLSAWLQRETLADRGLGGALSAASSTTSPVADITATTGVLFVLSGVALSIVTAAIATLMSAWYADCDERPGEALAAAFRCVPALTVAWLAVHVLEAAGLVGLAVGAVLVMPLFAVTAPAIAIERLGPWRAVRRSMRLVQPHYGMVLGRVLLVAVIDLVLTVALSGVALAFRSFDWGWTIDAFCSAGSALITVPFVAATATLIYFDLRVRSEGLDLELGIATYFADAR